MKKKGHPKYQEVLFVDSSTGYRFVCGSTLVTDKKEMFEGKEYPVYYASISSASHPFFTGNKQFVDSEGRVDKFLKKYAKTEQKLKSEEEKKRVEPIKKSKGKK